MKKSLFLFALMLICTFTRLIPHPVNFTPVLAIGLFSGLYFKNIKWSWLPVVVSMVVVDLFLGFHSTSLVVYFSVGMMPFFAKFINKEKNTFKTAIPATFLAAVFFFLTTNFAVWLLEAMYVKNLSGLMLSYVAGLPFFHNTLISTFCYFFSLVGAYKLVEKTSLSKALQLN